jgi:hypothetical protein
MEPMYHWLPHRIEAHVKICVFALLIERVAEVWCKKPWPQIKLTLDTLQTTEFHTPKNQFFQCNEASPDVLKVLKCLDISRPKVVLNLQSRKSTT